MRANRLGIKQDEERPPQMAKRGQNTKKQAAAVHGPETHLKTGSGRVALLLLGSLGARLTAGALPSRGLALASGHCERRIDAG